MPTENSQLNRMEDLLTQLITNVASSRGSIDKVQGSVIELQERVDKVQGSVIELQGRVDEVQGSVIEVRGRVDEVGREALLKCGEE